ncbi:hypothetical protein RHMOL_Rhmol04G0013700 [Rhododendron molle]|uniref:Uncharacterized protein n=2 Tax=Rhododendron molle TaxID=49168 RepID=A0ACC0NY66_RHOML|nr:hypothetical protein RHMOL_Rhmol04G0013700 [Rhododendron molle]KAI8557474.1 hypothetical protein RHMOL_Rhmol04G0013700 [Rhododendron molle]
MSGNVNIGLPTDKFSFGSLEPVEPPETQMMDETYIVLVSTGSFNPPTYMHLRMFELARDALKLEGFHVIGGYMSPVNDAYKKRGLISAKHRIELCHHACRSSEFIMVDPWEVMTTCRDFGVVCSRREGQDVDKIICNDDILSEYKNNIKVVNEIVPNQISSTRIRDCILSGLSVKYLASDEVIDYIKQHHLYSNSMVL